MTYDHITDQFNAALSDLARRMYAAIYEATSKAGATNDLKGYEVDEALKEESSVIEIGGDSEEAMLELVKYGLIEFATTGWRYRLTSAAWRAHLLAERAEREKEKPKQESVALGNCVNCGIELNNVTTGMVVVHRENRHITVCGPCADSLVARKLYTIVAQAKSLTDEADAALLRDATEGRR